MSVSTLSVSDDDMRRLSGVAYHYLNATEWVNTEAREDHSQEVEKIRKDRELCERIIKIAGWWIGS